MKRDSILPVDSIKRDIQALAIAAALWASLVSALILLYFLSS